MTLQEENQLLKTYLSAALWRIQSDDRVTRRYIHVDESGGSTYECTLYPWIEEAAKLCGIEPEKLLP